MAIGTLCEMIVARTGVNKSNPGNDGVVKMSFNRRFHFPFIQAERGGAILLSMGTKLHCPFQEINMLLPLHLILFEGSFFLSFKVLSVSTCAM